MALQDILERKEILLKPNDMTNEEKVKEILNCENCKKQLFIGGVKCPPTCADYNDLMKMAQWKDEQFKEQKKLTWKEVKYIIELDGDIETDNFMGSDEYYQAIADKANVVLFGLQGKLND